MSVAIESRARATAGTALRLLLGLAATLMLLSACQGSSGRIDHSYWRNVYGDPDTQRPDSVGTTCCRHAGQNGNR
jgi:hypothetical protein